MTSWENGSLLYVVTNHVKAVAFGSQKILPVTRYVESHSWAWGRKHSRGPIWGEHFRIFCLSKRRILVYFIFLYDGGEFKRRGAGLTYTLPLPLSRRACQ